MDDTLKEITEVEDLKKLLLECGGSTVRKHWSDDEDAILIEDQRICTGGMEGGSCWGGEPHPFSTGKTFSETKSALFQLLKEHWSDIGFFEYHEIVEEVMSEETETVGEYYGNSNTYRVRYIDTEKLLRMVRARSDG